MVVALFALSLGMIVGGIAAVVQGFPYVRLESGLAMVISGTTAASAGAVLLGLSAVLQQLKRSLQAFVTPEAAEFQNARSAEVSRESPGGPIFAESPPIPPALRADLAGATPEVALAEAVDPASIAAHDPFDREPEAERPLKAAALPPENSKPAMVEDDLFIEPEQASSRDKAKAEALALRPGLDDPPAASEPEKLPQDAEPYVVGTHASGGNTYVMFSDGTIEAETPRGRFTFNSLDELKEYIASGAETSARGAA